MTTSSPTAAAAQPPQAPQPPRPLRRALSEQDKDQRRQAILAAAKAVFAAKGYHATTVAEIARTAGLSYGSIYWYFDSKDALFHELIDMEGRALQRHVTDALHTTPASGAPDAPFRAAVRATFEFFEADSAAVKLLFRDAYALGEGFERHVFGIYERFLADIERVVADAQRQGLVADYPPRLVALAVGALVSQIAQRRAVTDDGQPASVVADGIVSLLLRGLLPRRER